MHAVFLPAWTHKYLSFSEFLTNYNADLEIISTTFMQCILFSSDTRKYRL